MSKIKKCPFRKGVINGLEAFLPCMGDLCMAYDCTDDENRCKLMRKEYEMSSPMFGDPRIIH